VVWTEIPALVRALAAGARQSGDALALQRLVIGLTEPFRQLETMTALANRALTGDEHAARELHLSRAAYFRRLRSASERVAAWGAMASSSTA